MKKAKRIHRGICFLILLMGLWGMTCLAAEPEIHTVQAPSEDVKIQFWLEEGVPCYRVESRGKVLVEDAKMGLNTSLGDLKEGFTLRSVSSSQADSVWNPVVGEQAQIRDSYRQTEFVLEHDSGVSLGIVMRAYDEGVAFCYRLPELPAGQESYTISDEYTQFVFPAGTSANVHIGNNQTVPQRVAVESFSGSVMQRPMTLKYTDGQLLTICEGNLDNYGVMVLRKDTSRERAVKAGYTSYKPSHLNETKGPVITVSAEGPGVTPWRALVIGRNETELMENASLVMNLNEEPDEETYQFSEWVEPGSCLRAASGMNTTAIKSIVDQAQANDIRYVLLDTGWYGPEYDVNCDPRLDPKKLDSDVASDKILLDKYFSTEGGYDGQGEGVFNTRGNGFDVYKDLGTAGSFNTNVDIPEICRYANERNVGIILYVNGVYFPDSSGRNRFTTDELFGYFEKWGVKGVKPGFVHVRAQEYESYMEKVIASAAKHRLVMTIHAEYVTTGIERTYPNLMQVEGILGDEGIGKNDPQIGEDISALFTRMIQGPADHTFCYPGKGTKAYALASPLMFRAGMSVLYWYTNPNSVPSQDKGKMDIWKGLPTTWSQSLYLEGKMYEYATIARKSKEDVWYVGSLSAVERTLKVPLDFLDENIWYVADVYADGADADARAGWNSAAKAAQTLENKKYLVNSETVLQRELKYGYGYAVKLTKASESDREALQVYNIYREELEAEVAEAQKLREENYTVETWKDFREALEAAERLAGEEETTDEQLAEALENLRNAQKQLCSTEHLTSLLKKAGRYVSYHYTIESWTALAEAVKEAETLLRGKFTQPELDAAAEKIETALEGLEKDETAVVKKTTYLSDLEYDREKSTCGPNNTRPSNIRKDKNRANGTLTLMVDGAGREFARGMGADAPSDLYYHIEGMGFEVFQSYVGVDAAKSNMGDITFRVYGDGELLYESKPSGTGANDAQFFSIPVAGVKELRLEADMNANDQGDWADWADAKFLTYRNPDVYLEGITVDGEPLEAFSAETQNYFYPVTDSERIPQVDAVPADEYVDYAVENAKELPGCADVKVTKRDGSLLAYRVFFLYTADADYISDLPKEAILKNTLYYGAVYKDKSVKGDGIALTASDGSSEMKFAKGIGTHASSTTDSMVIYDIAGRGYDRFEGYVGIRYATHEEERNGASPSGIPRSKVNFKIYVDNEAAPRFESGPMQSRTPAAYYNVDVRGAKTLKLVVDACGDQSADHGNWGDARFLRYRDIYTVSGQVDTGLTERKREGISVKLYKKEAAAEPEAEVLTDENGGYQFDAVFPGSYLVKVEAGEDNQEAAQEITVHDGNLEDITLTLKAPVFGISVLPVEGADVKTDKAEAAKGETVAVAIRDIEAGKKILSVEVRGEDGTVIEIAESSGEGNGFTFIMPKQAVEVEVKLQEDEEYWAAVRAASEIDAKILAIGEVTLEKKEAIEGVRAEYEAASELEKALVKQLSVLELSEYKWSILNICKQAEDARTAAAEARGKAEEAWEKAETAQENADEAARKAAEAQEKAKEAQAAAEAAAAQADADKAVVEQAKADAQTAAAAAETARQNSADAAAQAEQAKRAAETAQRKAEEAQSAAETARTAAEEARKGAEESQNKAEEARRTAEQARDEAAAARDTAAAAQTAAESARDSAIAQVNLAAAAQTAAEAAKIKAEAAQEAAELARQKAEEAQAKAEETLKKAQEEAAAQLAKAEEAMARAEAAEREALEAQKQAEEARTKAEAAAQAALEAKAAFEAAQKPTEGLKTEEPVQEIQEGQTYDSGDYYYKVTSVSGQTAEITGVKNKALTKITVYNTVTLGGKSYQVTAVAASAFKGNKKVTGAVIGKNVKTIGSSAFSGCTNLKTVTVKSTKLTQMGSKTFYNCKALKRITIKSKALKKAGKNAFKGIHKKAVIKVPPAKKKAYAKLLAKKGQSDTVKIK